jgi:hypothetical protein
MRRSVALLSAAAAALCAAAVPSSAHAAITCDQTASPSGAITTAQGLVNALSAGQTGCFRAGLYTGDVTVNKDVTLQSYGGEAATIRGRVLVTANGASLEKLMLDGRNSGNLPSPTVQAANVTVRDNDITTVDTPASCVLTQASGSLVPNNVLIERNRIHDCGTSSPYNNNVHGIYLTAGSSGIVRNNVVFDNSARGVQITDNTASYSITNNVSDNNGTGMQWSYGPTNNASTNNVVTNANNRWNAETYSLTGTGNSFSGNCVQASNASSYYNSDGGIALVEGFSSVVSTGSGNTTANPSYANRAGKDFRVTAASCSGKGAPSSVAGLEPDTTIESGASGTITVNSATYTFSSNRPGVTFECSMDSTTTYTACVGPKAYSGLANGAHTFRVRAVLNGVVDATPAAQAFTVALPTTCNVTAQVGTTIDTPGELYAALSPGQTGCFRGGTYTEPNGSASTWGSVYVAKSNVTFRSYPGEVATIRSRWVINNGANFVKVENLKLDLSNVTESVGLVITGDDATVRNNDIDAGNTWRICVHPNANGSAIPDRFLIDGNRIHGCGLSPTASWTWPGPPPASQYETDPDNHAHAIYIAAGNGEIRNNVIYNNRNRGIQFYPNPNGVSVHHNTIDFNGEGVSWSDASANASVTNNLVTNSKLRWNFETYALTGTGNSASGNCVWASNSSSYYNSDGGVALVEGFASEVSVGTGNPVQNPGYTNATSRDYRFSNASCSGKGAPDSVANPTGFPAT